MSLGIAMVGACPFPVPQGSQALIVETARALQARGHEVRLVVYGYGADASASPGAQNCRLAGLQIHRTARMPWARKTAAGPSLVKPLLDGALAATLRRVLRRHAVDVVHAHNYEGLLVALAAGKRPIVYHAHNAMVDELPYYFRGRRLAGCRGPHGRFLPGLGRWLDRAFPRRADHVIAPHQRLAEYLIECGCAANRVSVVPPSVEVGLFEPGAPSTGQLPPVLYTGNLDAYQNLGLLYRAIARVRKAAPGARLIIATHVRALIRQAEWAPTPDFDSLRRVLAQDAVVACPRVAWSGYPMKLLNAMAARKAIVASRGAAYPLTNGSDGLVVPDDDEGEFADAVVRLMRDATLRDTLGRAARDTARNTHSPDRIAQQIENVYAKAL